MMGDPNFNLPPGKAKRAKVVGPRPTPVRDAKKAAGAAFKTAKTAWKAAKPVRGGSGFAAPGVGSPVIKPMPGESGGGKFRVRPGGNEGPRNTGVVGPMPKPPTPKPFTKPMVRPNNQNGAGGNDTGESFGKPMKSHRAPWRQ